MGAGIVAAGALGYVLTLTTSGLETAFLALGAGALSYLVFEEAMREAHEQRQGAPFAAAG